MDVFKGTPGPWIKEVRKSKIVAILPQKYGQRVIETVLQTGYISSDDCGNPVCCCVEEHANAQLIATAPDLLEVCMQFVNSVDTCDTKEQENAYVSAKLAISKAIGRS